jgi:hypothetical protein
MCLLNKFTIEPFHISTFYMVIIRCLYVVAIIGAIFICVECTIHNTQYKWYVSNTDLCIKCFHLLVWGYYFIFTEHKLFESMKPDITSSVFLLMKNLQEVVTCRLYGVLLFCRREGKKLCIDGLISLIYTTTSFVVVVEISQTKLMAKAHLFPMPMKRIS